MRASKSKQDKDMGGGGLCGELGQEKSVATSRKCPIEYAKSQRSSGPLVNYFLCSNRMSVIALLTLLPVIVCWA